MKDKILCIDDDLTIQAVVEATLSQYHVISAHSLSEAESLLCEHQFSSLLVDIRLPDGDGLRFVNKFLQGPDSKDIPVLIFSNHKDISNKVLAFSLGVEDFIEKPFDPIELKARVDARIMKRRSSSDQKNRIQLGDVVLDLDRQKVFQISKSKEIDLQLTAYEIKILKMLSKRMEQVYSRQQILDNVWSNTFITERTIDSHIAHLRKKIMRTKLSLNTVKNFGYSLTLRV